MASRGGRPPNYYAILEVPETATPTQIRDAYKRAALKTHPDRIPTDHPDRAARTRKFQLVNDAYYTLSDAARRRDYDAQRKLYSGFGTAGTRARTRTSTGAAGGASGGGGGGGAHMPGGFAGGFDPFADADEAEAEAAAASGAGGGGGGGDGGAPSPGGGNDFFSWAWNFFARGGAGGATAQRDRARTEDEQFADVFEEMLREEGMATDGGGAGAGAGARPTGKFWSVVGGVSGGALGFIVANVPGLVAGAVAGNRLGAVRDARGKSVYAVFQELPQADRARLLSQLAARVLSHAAGV